MKEPVDHILRPRLPWRAESAITECGYNGESVKSLTREQFAARLKEYGQQRTGLFTCMTCMQAAERWPTWQEEPRLAMEREIQWEAVHWSRGVASQWGEGRGRQMFDELLAIETLIAAHPEEFQQLVSDIDSRRQWLEKKAKAAPPKAKPDRGGGPKWRPV